VQLKNKIISLCQCTSLESWNYGFKFKFAETNKNRFGTTNLFSFINLVASNTAYNKKDNKKIKKILNIEKDRESLSSIC